MIKNLLNRVVMMMYVNVLQLIISEYSTGDIRIIYENALTQLENSKYFVGRS